MLPNEDIVPITFMNGTGGNFLCHFIVMAKRNIKDILELSKHGNAHEFGIKDVGTCAIGINSPDKDKVEFLLSQSPIFATEKPYYTSCHIRDLNIVNDNFKKSIRIVYDKEDIEEINHVFYGKWFIDNDIKKRVKPMYKSQIGVFINFYRNDFIEIENMPNVLFISWKEFFKGNIEKFITKLSIFTGINVNNFSRESLLHWRNKTQYCIDKFTYHY
jgi:hypothetical protein